MAEIQIKVHSVIIIGGGCAGLTAGLYCARAELYPLIFTGFTEDQGGLLVKTSIVENYPGFSEGILGYDLIKEMEEQSKKYGAKIIDKEITSVDFSSNPKVLIDSDGNVHHTKTVIIATGSTPNKLKLERVWTST